MMAPTHEKSTIGGFKKSPTKTEQMFDEVLPPGITEGVSTITPSLEEFTFAGFNMRRAKAQQMFEEDLPPRLTIVLTGFLNTPGKLDPSVFARGYRALFRILDLPEADPMRFGIQSTLTPVAPLESSFGGFKDLPLNQQLWFYDNLYLQIGFADSAKCRGALDDFGNVTTMSMTGYDVGVACTGSPEPKDHLTFVGNSLFKLVYTTTVGRLFRARIMIWNRKLLGYRTALMVMMRAELMGRDPEQEYQRFVDAGGKYFLEYPALCP